MTAPSPPSCAPSTPPLRESRREEERRRGDGKRERDIEIADLDLAFFSFSFCRYIKHQNLYVVAATKKNANIALVFVFLHKLVQVFVEYFKELEEESIRDNFVLIYELLDELMDFGYPQTTDTKILQEYITQQASEKEKERRRIKVEPFH
jgi:hypothetical protein